jgi:hypothetical protein
MARAGRRDGAASRAKPENRDLDRHDHAQQVGETAGRVIGGGLGVMIGVGLILLVLGPVLWAPLLAGLSAVGKARIQSDSYWLASAAGLGAGLLVAFAQFLLLVQKNPLIRYPAVLLFSVVWVGGQWLALKGAFVVGGWIGYRPIKTFTMIAPAWPVPNPWEWALIGLGTVIYAGLYLLILTRFGKGRWAKRWQLIK